MERQVEHHGTKQYVWWQGQDFCGTRYRLVVFAALKDWKILMRPLHDEDRHWDTIFRKKLSPNNLEPILRSDLAHFVRTFDISHRMGILPTYLVNRYTSQHEEYID